jgi:hypothetical protein
MRGHVISVHVRGGAVQVRWEPSTFARESSTFAGESSTFAGESSTFAGESSTFAGSGAAVGLLVIRFGLSEVNRQ